MVLGGRAPEMRWGSGSLQEIDHLPFVSPLTKSAVTVKDTARIPAETCAAIDAAIAQPSGPTFVDYPLDVVFQEAEAYPSATHPKVTTCRHQRIQVTTGRRWGPGLEEAAALLAAAERPAIMAGTGLYWARGEEELRALAEALGIPVFLNGMGRGCLPADHELCFSRARGKGLKEADVALDDRPAAGLPARLRRRAWRGDEDPLPGFGSRTS